MGVGTIGKAAQADVRAEVAVQASDFFRNDVPQLKLADARSIDNVAADFQRDQASDRCSVFALLILTADGGDAEASSGSMELSSDDLPTPLCPATTLSLPASSRRRRSMPWPVGR